MKYHAATLGTITCEKSLTVLNRDKMKMRDKCKKTTKICHPYKHPVSEYLINPGPSLTIFSIHR